VPCELLQSPDRDVASIAVAQALGAYERLAATLAGLPVAG
jgi:hypothetical protein